MNSIPDLACCPDCGCPRVIDAGRGLTCTACGLVIDETPSFVVSDQRGKDGVISSHSVLHANTTTLVGTMGERAGGAGGGARLARTQRRAVAYQASKASRVYHVVRAAVAGAQLPDIVVEHAVHAAEKIAAVAPKGSLMAGPAMASALAVFVACKKLGILRPRDEWIAMAASIEVERKSFLRHLVRLRAIGKELRGAPRQGAIAGAATVVHAALATLRDVVGPGDHLSLVRLVHSHVARALVGMRADSAAAVTAFLAGQLLSPAGIPLTLIANAAAFRAASLYNAVKRVVAKLGVVLDGPLSKAKLGMVLRSRVLVAGGVARVAPVPVVAGPAILAALIEETPVTAATIPSIVTDSPLPLQVLRVAPLVESTFPPSITHPPSPSPRQRGRKPMAEHVFLAPTLLVIAARGNALRLLDHVRRSRATTQRQRQRGMPTGPPPCLARATGLGPPVPLALLGAIDGG